VPGPGSGTSPESASAEVWKPESAEVLLQHRGEPGDGVGLLGRQGSQLGVGRRQLAFLPFTGDGGEEALEGVTAERLSRPNPWSEGLAPGSLAAQGSGKDRTLPRPRAS
jgi:hypothetical protein